jgi:hypothetical protein
LRLLAFGCLALGVTAPFGTTILGLVSVTQIRRSGGRLCGLGLALGDALFFPLLALDAGIYGFWYFAFRAVETLKGTGATGEAHLLVVWIPALLTAAAVDFLIVRAAWRMVALRSAARAAGEKEPPEYARKRGLIGGVALGLSLGGLLLAVLLALLAGLMQKDATMPAYALFWAFQVAAFVLGAVSFKDPFGKSASITAAVLALGSVLTLA